MTTNSADHQSGLPADITRRRLLVTGAGAAASLAIAACGGSSPSATTAAAGPVRRGGTLRVGFIGAGEADTLNPFNVFEDFSLGIANGVYNALVVPAPDGSPQLSLAESMEPNAKATVWTIKLRSGVEWHDGKPLTADDVIYSLRYIGAPKSTSPAALPVSRIDLKNLKKLDNLTVQVPLLTPIADLKAWLQLGDSLPTFIVQNGTTNFNHPIGTGPFKFVNWVKAHSAELVKNPNYWEHGKPYVDRLSFVELPDPTARVNALQSGSIDAAAAIPFATARQFQSGGGQIKLLNAKTPGFLPITMSVDQAPFNDVRVRQAFRLIADRPALVAGATSGFGQVANDLYGRGLQWYDTSIPQRTQDIEQAKSLLKQAGRENLHVTLNTGDIAEGVVPSATIFAQQASAAGVTVAIKQYPGNSYFSSGYLKWALGQDYWTLNSIPTFFAGALLSNGPYNSTHWRRPSWDKLFYDALGDTNTSTAEQKWDTLQKELWNEGGFLIWGTTAWVDGLSTKVQGAVPNASYNLSNCEFTDWWLSA